MANEPTAKIISTNVICRQPGRYIGWPTIARTHNGDLVVVFSGDRDAHICPWGKTQMVRSSDGGKTWAAPVTINNTPLDDRDAGIIETDKGTLVVSWFTSLAFSDPGQVSWLPETMRNGWMRHIEKLDQETRAKWLGNWIRRSEDGGKTWGVPIRNHVSAPHGPIKLSDKRLIYVGTGTKDGKGIIGVEESRDDGRSWSLLATVPIPSDEVIAHYDEPHVVEAENGKLVAMFRSEPKDRSQCFLKQSESTDGGKSWSLAHKTAIWGYPPHLIRLRNGWLLVVYGRRMPPFGEQACISRDAGKTWDTAHEIILAGAPNDDLGYPASVQLDDGSIFTVFYQCAKSDKNTCLMATHWQLAE
ncbi:MAG: sialidase family protein [Kiritimatiellaeota bacterium]|nr:sialidase family protein [Kiritimatiellota bacterium]